jgi:hypothetical protein
MTAAKRLSLLSLLACLMMLALQPAADAARRLSDEEVSAKCVTNMTTLFNKNRTKIIGFGEGAVVKINALQARSTSAATITKAANTARVNIAKALTAANKALEAEALRGVRELNKRNASSNLIDDINRSKNERLTALQGVADECYAAINTALAD